MAERPLALTPPLLELVESSIQSLEHLELVSECLKIQA